MRTFAISALLVVAAAVSAAASACHQSTPLPPLLEDVGDASPPQACAPGNECHGFEYCIAGPSAGCRYLACLDGGWACPPDAGESEAGTTVDAGDGTDSSADAGADSSAECGCAPGRRRGCRCGRGRCRGRFRKRAGWVARSCPAPRRGVHLRHPR